MAGRIARGIGQGIAQAGRLTVPQAMLWLAAQALAERDRWALWAPVWFGLGIAIYFLLPAEPSAWWAMGALVLLAPLALLLKARPLGLLCLVVTALVVSGFGAAQWRANAVAAPVLKRETGPVWLEARVLNAQAQEGGLRLTLDRLQIERFTDPVPERVRVTVRGQVDVPAVGSWTRLRAMLSPPAAPAAPGAFDFARFAWFQQLGGVGFSVARPRPVEAPDGMATDGWQTSATLWLNGARQSLTRRILQAVPGPAGAVAAALMTGERSAIPPEVDAAYRDSGLAHILSISGLHLALVAGIVFTALRFLLALWERVALRYPIKKWAAVAALLATFAYMMLSGADVPTQRSFLMTGLVLLAVLVDRSAISMRSVAWAALAVLLLMPESLLNAGFQMSFAAVAALIAAYEVIGTRLSASGDRGIVVRAGLYLAGAAATTVIAGLATAPFAAFHFGRFVDFGLVANVLAVPLASLWIMPWGVLAFLLMPFGLERLALWPMGWGVEGLNLIAAKVASWPGAVSLIPAMPEWTLAAVALGGLWLCLWRRKWRLLGLVPLCFAAASPFLSPPPDLLIHPDGQMAVTLADGSLAIGGGAGIVAETWLRRAGERTASPWPGDRELVENKAGRLTRRGARAPAVSADGRLRCDVVGCTYRADGWMVALPRDTAATAEDCQSADLVLATVPVRGRCPAARLVVDRRDLNRDGAHAVWLGKNRIRVESVGAQRGRRLWTGAAPADQ